jgi:hypothetical protein
VPFHPAFARELVFWASITNTGMSLGFCFQLDNTNLYHLLLGPFSYYFRDQPHLEKWPVFNIMFFCTLTPVRQSLHKTQMYLTFLQRSRNVYLFIQFIRPTTSFQMIWNDTIFGFISLLYNFRKNVSHMVESEGKWETMEWSPFLLKWGH